MQMNLTCRPRARLQLNINELVSFKERHVETLKKLHDREFLMLRVSENAQFSLLRNH
jgi:hypothetical protein